MRYNETFFRQVTLNSLFQFSNELYLLFLGIGIYFRRPIFKPWCEFIKDLKEKSKKQAFDQGKSKIKKRGKKTCKRQKS